MYKYITVILFRFKVLLFVFGLTTGIVFAEPDSDGPVTLNLNDADISTFITVIGKVTGKSFIIDPRVKGRVTVISQHAMTQDEVYQVFLSTLKVHGYTAVDSNGSTKIIPLESVKEDVMKLGTNSEPGRGDEYITRVLKLRQVSAFQILPLIRPMAAKEAHVVAYAPSNVLIIVDRADNVKRIEEVIARIDRSTQEDIEVINLKYASANDVVRMLQELQSASAQDAVPDMIANFVAVERTNSILLSGEKSARLRIRGVLAKLDTRLSGSASNIKVIYLHNAKAADLVNVLNGMKETIEEHTSDSVVYEGEMAMEGETGPDGIPYTTNTTNTTTIINTTSIQADEGTNSIVISAQPDVMRSLESVIRQLDIRRAQVLVEAIIVEITEGRSEELGLQWLFGGKNALHGTTVFPGAGPNPVGIAAGASGDSSELATALAGLVGLNIGAGGKTDSGVVYGALLHALSTDDGANVLSTPSIITMDNEEASIVVGQEVPFVTGSITANNTNPFQTIAREEVGIKLKILPQINEGDSVRLEITQEVSSVTAKAEAQDLVTNKREINTTVLARDGSTVVLGGLISSEHNENEQKVPLLGDLPIVGHLFKSTKAKKEKRNLVVFIRPTIIRDDRRLDEISGRKYSYIRDHQLEAQERGIALMPSERPEVLPTWNPSEILPWRLNSK